MNDLQRTAEWHADRCGKVTASRIVDVMAKTKSGWGAGRKNYMAQLAAERLTGVQAEGFTNAAMQWGTDHEPDAIAAYEFFTDNAVTPVGFIDHPSIPMTGASPDGLVGLLGLVEIKCPNTSTHIDTLLGSKIDRKYLLQMHWQMACTQRDYCDFVSFDPRMPPSMQLYIERVELDAKLMAEITEAVSDFVAELDTMVNELRDTYEAQEAA